MEKTEDQILEQELQQIADDLKGEAEKSVEAPPATEEPKAEPEKPADPQKYAEEQPAEAAAETPSEEDKSKWIDGRFKTADDLLKSYKEAEKFIGKAGEYEKKYKDLLGEKEKRESEEKARQMAEVKRAGFSSVEEKEIADKAQYFEAQELQRLIPSIPQELREEASALFNQYCQTGNRDIMAQFLQYVHPADFTRISRAAANYENSLRDEMKTTQSARAHDRIVERLVEFDTANPGWLDNQHHKNAISEVLKANPEADLGAVKTLVEAIENDARSSASATVESANKMKAATKTVQGAGSAPATGKSADDEDEMLKQLVEAAKAGI